MRVNDYSFFFSLLIFFSSDLTELDLNYISLSLCVYVLASESFHASLSFCYFFTLKLSSNAHLDMH